MELRSLFDTGFQHKHASPRATPATEIPQIKATPHSAYTCPGIVRLFFEFEQRFEVQMTHTFLHCAPTEHSGCTVSVKNTNL